MKLGYVFKIQYFIIERRGTLYSLFKEPFISHSNGYIKHLETNYSLQNKEPILKLHCKGFGVFINFENSVVNDFVNVVLNCFFTFLSGIVWPYFLEIFVGLQIICHVFDRIVDLNYQKVYYTLLLLECSSASMRRFSFHQKEFFPIPSFQVQTQRYLLEQSHILW